MTTKLIKVFLDSSVIIAGLASPRGGSREILNLVELKILRGVISETVVREVSRNIEKKLPQCLPQYYQLFRSLPFLMAEPTEPCLFRARELINQADSLILAAALEAQVEWLISLDKHFLNLAADRLPFKVVTPRDFLFALDLRPDAK